MRSVGEKASSVLDEEIYLLKDLFKIFYNIRSTYYFKQALGAIWAGTIVSVCSEHLLMHSSFSSWFQLGCWT